MSRRMQAGGAWPFAWTKPVSTETTPSSSQYCKINEDDTGVRVCA